jgi:hypothetical protein
MRSASKGGHFRGLSDLVIDLAAVLSAGRAYRVRRSDIAERGNAGIGGDKPTAEVAGAGRRFGAIVGAIAGGSNGAAIGGRRGCRRRSAHLTTGTIKGSSGDRVLSFQFEAPLR